MGICAFLVLRNSSSKHYLVETKGEQISLCHSDKSQDFISYFMHILKINIFTKGTVSREKLFS